MKRFLLTAIAILLPLAATGETKRPNCSPTFRHWLKTDEHTLSAEVASLIEKSQKAFGTHAETMAVPPAHPRIKDSPFGDFRFGNTSFRYVDLPENVPPDAPDFHAINKVTNRVKGYDQFVYFGKPLYGAKHQVDTLRNFFVYGRSSRGISHRDVHKHLHSADKDGIQSGFFQTSVTLYEAERFAAGPVFEKPNQEGGIVFIIDPKGAETLYVPGFQAATRVRESIAFRNEGELLFNNTIAPDRIVAAWIYKKGETKPSRLVLNPNYRPR